MCVLVAAYLQENSSIIVYVAGTAMLLCHSCHANPAMLCWSNFFVWSNFKCPLKRALQVAGALVGTTFVLGLCLKRVNNTQPCEKLADITHIVMAYIRAGQQTR